MNNTDEANELIDALGGTAAVAKLCEVNSQAVSQWRRKGIPKARLKYLELLRPDLFQRSTTHADEQSALAAG